MSCVSVQSGYGRCHTGNGITDRMACAGQCSPVSPLFHLLCYIHYCHTHYSTRTQLIISSQQKFFSDLIHNPVLSKWGEMRVGLRDSTAGRAGGGVAACLQLNSARHFSPKYMKSSWQPFTMCKFQSCQFSFMYESCISGKESA